MNKDAFELIGKLMENDQVIKEIVFTKKGFRVRWVREPHLFHFKITQDGIEEFLELYESYEKDVEAEN